MLKLSNIVQRMAKGWVVILLLVLFVLTVSLFFPLAGRLLKVPEGVETIDTRLYYTPAELYQIMDTYGQEGRQGYAVSHVSADLLFPLVYAFFFGTAISFTFRLGFPDRPRLQRLNLVPFALLAVDLLENISLLVLLLAFPHPLTPLAAAAGAITFVKWLLSGASVLLPFIGLGVWLYRLLRRRR